MPNPNSQVRIKGTVLKLGQTQSPNGFVTQALVAVDESEHDYPSGRILCMWRSNDTFVTLAESGRYMFTGTIYERNGQQILVQPDYVVIGGVSAEAKVAADALPGSTLAKTRLSKILKAQRRTKVITAAVAGVAALVAVMMIGHGMLSSNQQVATSAAATKAGIQALPVTTGDCDTKAVPHKVQTKNDASLAAGKEVIERAGADGTDIVCYPNGRDHFPVTTHTKRPLNEVKKIGTNTKP